MPSTGQDINIPILYSFRRCPYAMRARMALQLKGLNVELREVDLKNKPPEMIETSAKDRATVPILILDDGTVIEESLEVVDWALEPDYSDTDKKVIAELDDSFIPHLNRYKYPSRYEDAEPEKSREICEAYLDKLNALCVKHSGYLASQDLSATDIIVFPFVRQFRIVDHDVFDRAMRPALQKWFDDIHQSALFEHIMIKHDPWSAGDEQVILKAVA